MNAILQQRCRLIPRTVIHFLFIAITILLIEKNYVSSTKEIDAFVVGENPFDDWCSNHCHSFAQCSELFGDDHADLNLKLDTSFQTHHVLFHGDRVSKQSFETQFIFDISETLDTSPCRIHVRDIVPQAKTIKGQKEEEEINVNEDEIYSVLISFRLFPANVSDIRTLTFLVQDYDSKFYEGEVTKTTDQYYGLQVEKWDMSLKLMFSINVIGEKQIDVKEKEDSGISYLDQGRENRWCDNQSPYNSSYCEFDQFFREDVAFSLSMEPDEIDLLFIKESGKDSIIITFRLLTSQSTADSYKRNAIWMNIQHNNLLSQVEDLSSDLYMGNVTVRVDRTWGVSGQGASPREVSPYLPYNVIGSINDSYERCKSTHRCSRAWSFYNQTTANLSSTTQLFAGGKHYDIALFADFEDWRQGTHGWNLNSDLHQKKEIPGSHWSPFDFEPLGPTIPAFNTSSNNGLVLNKRILDRQIDSQNKWIEEIKQKVEWLQDNLSVATLDAKNRARIDVRRDLTRTRNEYQNLLSFEVQKLHALSESQCMYQVCTLTFNTTSLELTGAINATGSIEKTKAGEEVAIWSFDSINIDKGVKIILVGARPMALLSRSSIYIDTPIIVHPGTFGGFTGGEASKYDSVNATPYTIYVGGSGGGYGGTGGVGFRDDIVGTSYGDEFISNLYAGSGGSSGCKTEFEANTYTMKWGRGGAGGGAIELSALNDIILGENLVISCNGESGEDGFMTGAGGGSGGSINIAAGGIVRIHGNLSVKGGNGGSSNELKKGSVQDGHGGGGSGGRIAVYGQSISFHNGGLRDKSTFDVSGGICSKTERENCTGNKGTIYIKEVIFQEMFIEEDIGASGTRHSLYLKQKDDTEDMSLNEFEQRSHATQISPNFDFGDGIPKKPSRISFFVKLEPDNRLIYHQDGRGVAFELQDNSHVYNMNSTSTRTGSHKSVGLGVFIGKKMRHGANYNSLLGDTTYQETLEVFHSKTIENKWYQVDILIDWGSLNYDIYLDDLLAVNDASFHGPGFTSLRITNSHKTAGAWIDEIYVGFDTTMGFKCPISIQIGDKNAQMFMERPMQSGWENHDFSQYQLKHGVHRHESHVSKRPLYNNGDIGGMIPFDGEGHKFFSSSSMFFNASEQTVGKFLHGSITRISSSKYPDPITEVSDYMNKNNSSRFIWYGEHNGAISIEENGESVEEVGGIGSCSTSDFITWRNEGIMLDFKNISDMVDGITGRLHVEKPKVLYNKKTQNYVMWMVIENETNTLSMAGVAVSRYPNGPFEFVRSFYPDGNLTKDQTVYQEKESEEAYLIRTYFATVDYILPSAVMQPTWESVKNDDGSTNFALSYHRANYSSEYDNYDDIKLQRWRKEDVPWKVVCVNKITGEERIVEHRKADLNDNDQICNEPVEFKKTLGQGSQVQNNSLVGIESRYLDPNDLKNNVWKPNSVPGVKAQPWSANFKDGICGMRKRSLSDEDNQPRESCSNIVDNPIHRSLPDKLIGEKKVVERRREKFVSVSKLTEDFLDTTGVQSNYEGRLEDNINLITIMKESVINGFKWNSGSNLGTTYQSDIEDKYFRTIEDWERRFHQFEHSYNDRALYSTACVLDGICPVNFKDQLTEGHN